MDLTGFASMFGLNMTSIAALAGIVVMITNILKEKMTGLTGNWIYLPVAGLSFFFSWKSLYPNWEQIAMSTIAVGLLAISGWSSAKALAHKAGSMTPPAPSP